VFYKFKRIKYCVFKFLILAGFRFYFIFTDIIDCKRGSISSQIVKVLKWQRVFFATNCESKTVVRIFFYIFTVICVLDCWVLEHFLTTLLFFRFELFFIVSTFLLNVTSSWLRLVSGCLTATRFSVATFRPTSRFILWFCCSQCLKYKKMIKLDVCSTMHIFIIWCIQISTCENLNQNSKNKMDKITCNYRELEFGNGEVPWPVNEGDNLSATFCLPAKKNTPPMINQR